MATNNSQEPTNCIRFGYARLENDIIIKVKPVSIINICVNNFRSNEYTVIESYDFFTKQLKDIHYVGAGRLFYYNETDAFFNDYNTFGQLTGKYEFVNFHGYKTVLYLSNGKLHRDNDLPAKICYYGDYSNPQKLKILVEKWYVNGKLHRDGDLPAEIY
jgi:hypothetical protein